MLLINVIKELELVPVDLLTVEITQALETIRDSQCYSEGPPPIK